MAGGAQEWRTLWEHQPGCSAKGASPEGLAGAPEGGVWEGSELQGEVNTGRVPQQGASLSWEGRVRVNGEIPTFGGVG
jgi:hypothetical protein